MSDMEIQNAIEQAWNERGVPLPDDAADLMFVAAEAARVCVAAELRRQADALDEWAAPGGDTLRLPEPMTLQATAARLRARADELDRGTS